MEIRLQLKEHAGRRHTRDAETVFIASALRAGAAVGHGLMAMRRFEERRQ